ERDRVGLHHLLVAARRLRVGGGCGPDRGGPLRRHRRPCDAADGRPVCRRLPYPAQRRHATTRSGYMMAQILRVLAAAMSAMLLIAGSTAGSRGATSSGIV